MLQLGHFAVQLGTAADLSITEFGHRAIIPRTPRTFLRAGSIPCRKGKEIGNIAKASCHISTERWSRVAER